MLFYRMRAPAPQISINAVRGCSMLALAAYPVGALIINFANHAPLPVAIGYGLILVSLACVVPLVSSSLQRIVAESPASLDEYELQLRSRAMNQSYGGFTVLTLAGVIYAAVAVDHGGWVPVTYEQFNGLFWGVFLYASVMPVACLSWLVDASFEAGQ
ncbi:hypothetical protein [Novosphingobium sp.]|uniref:hypothetical protein n=1 Tax=Novosphingobium sp. TaxID=1874826 RepID=UPI0033414EBF